MKRWYLSILLAISLSLFTVAITAQQPCSGISSLAECPDTGCGNGDGELNKKKNRTDDTPSNIQSRTLGQIRAFSEPASRVRGQDRTSIAFREDRGVVVKAFLLDARVSAKDHQLQTRWRTEQGLSPRSHLIQKCVKGNSGDSRDRTSPAQGWMGFRQTGFSG